MHGHAENSFLEVFGDDEVHADGVDMLGHGSDDDVEGIGKLDSASATGN